MKIDKTHLALKFLIVVLFYSLPTPVLQAQDVIADSVVIKRLHFIDTTLKQDKLHTQRWWYTWLAGYSAGTVVQGAVFMGSNDLNTRQDMALGAATALIGAAGQFITPIMPGHEPEKFDAISDSTKDLRLIKLTLAEELLYEVGLREKLAWSWKNHALTGAINLSSGLITWLAFDRSVWAGVGNFALNSVVTETQIRTQPMLARRNYLKYQKSIINGDGELSFIPRVNWFVGAYAGGAGLKVVF